MKLKFWILLLFSIFLIFFFKKNYSLMPINWQFYTIKSVGANNKLSLYNNLVFDENNLFFNTQNQKTYSINQNSGEINWQLQTQDYSPFPPLITNDQIFLSNFDGNIYSLDKKTGYKLWQFNLDQQYIPDTPIVSSTKNNIVFFGSRNGILYALNKQTGQKLWAKEFKGIDQNKAFVPETIHFGSIYADSGQVYVINAVEKNFSAFNQINGELNWQIENISFSFDSPLFYEQRIILKQNNILLSIDKISGDYTEIKKQGKTQSNWQIFKVENDQEYILILDDLTLFKQSIDFKNTNWLINNCNAVLHVRNKINEPFIELTNNKIITQNHLLLENNDPLIALNYESGKIEWSASLNSLINNQLILDENLLLGGSNGDLTSINTNNGQVNWQIKLDGEIVQLILINDQILSINQKAGKKISLNYLTKDGKEIWQYTPDHLIDAKEIYTHKNNVYFLNTDKNLIEKINITKLNPNQEKLKNVNFSYQENKENHNPYLEIKEDIRLTWKIKEKWLKIKYVIKNFKQIFSFELNEEINNGIFEISLTHDEQLYLNKFIDLQIEAIFAKENEPEIKVKGFYYDYNTWKIRFLAPKTGSYQYSITIKSPYFIKKFSGNIQINNVNNETLKINNNQFTINDETVFFPIGIQDSFVDRNYNGKITEEMPDSSSLQPVTNKEQYAYLNLENYLNTFQKEAGLNIFRYGVENVSPALWQSIDLKTFSLDVNGGKFGDQLLQELNKKDYKIIMTIFGFYPPYRTKEEISKKENRQSLAIYLDYIIARFSPYVDLFELSNEAEAHVDWYKFVIDYLKENDPYQRPISTNWETSKIKNLDFQSIHWYNQNEIQPGYLSREINYLNKKYINDNQPILISEFGFKNYSWFENSSESLRILTWLSVFQKMGIIFWNQGQNGIYENPDNANVYLGPKERSYLLSLNNFLPKDMKLPIETKQFVIEKNSIQVYLINNQELMLGYLLKINRDIQEPAYLNLDLKNKALIQWIDPKTNFVLSEEIVEKNQLDLKIPDFEVDLAIKIKYLE